MKGVKVLIVLFGTTFFACQKKMECKPEYNATQYVDTQLGSVGARWFFYTPASCLLVWQNLHLIHTHTRARVGFPEGTTIVTHPSKDSGIFMSFRLEAWW